MRTTAVLGTIAACLLVGSLGCSKYLGTGAKNAFIAKADKLAFEVARQKPAQGRMSADEVAAIFQQFIDESPEVQLVGDLEVKVVPFPNGGNDEPPEVGMLKTLYKGNARNLAIRDRNVELVGIVATVKVGDAPPFTVEEWAYVADGS